MENNILKDVIKISQKLELKKELIQDIKSVTTLYFQVQENKYIKVFYKVQDSKKIKIAKTVKKELIDLNELELLIKLFKYFKVLELKENLKNELKELNYFMVYKDTIAKKVKRTNELLKENNKYFEVIDGVKKEISKSTFYRKNKKN